jgi:NAD(P)-dependent dehydrogenase (short-subunit alcohol dehydrogenase family)
MAKQSVVITGANTGIGRATAELLASRGYRVVGTARDLEKGRDLAEAAAQKDWDLTLLSLDVRQEDSVREAFRRAGTVDVLVNNAGFEVWGPIEELSVDDLIDQFETNVYGVFRCIKAVLPSMRERRHGIIVNLSSLQGRVASPLGAPYCASKHALEALSESLYYEVRHFGVRIHLIEPGTIETAFLENRRWGDSSRTSSHYQPLADQWERGFRGIQDEFGRAEPIVAAEAILDAIEKGDKLRYPVGADAEMVLAARQQMDDETFEATMREKLGLTW